MIFALWKLEYSFRRISEILLDQGYQIPFTTASTIIQKIKENGNFDNQRKSNNGRYSKMDEEQQ